jgi:uncharacterized protein YutE (UPF0331/DUF86 family)
VVEPGTVRALLGTIEHRLARLSAMSNVPLEDFQRDPDLQDIAERNFEVLIQACIDLGLHILADRAGTLPETNRAVFASLVREAILDPCLGRELEKMAGFRNLLAHGYTRLIPAMVHASLDHLDDVGKYVKQVTQYLKEQLNHE